MQSTRTMIFATAMMATIPACAGEPRDSAVEPESAEAPRSNEAFLREDTPSATVSARDEVFAVQATLDGLRELELGRIAVTQATTEPVKQYAQMIVDDHSESLEQLQALAKAKHIALPTTTGPTFAADKRTLEGLEWADFDSTYISMMIAAQQQAIASFTEQAERGSDDDLRQFAASTLKTHEHHHQRAREIRQSGGQIGLR